MPSPKLYTCPRCGKPESTRDQSLPVDCSTCYMYVLQATENRRAWREKNPSIWWCEHGMMPDEEPCRLCAKRTAEERKDD